MLIVAYDTSQVFLNQTCESNHSYCFKHNLITVNMIIITIIITGTVAKMRRIGYYYSNEK